jgi:hypothetical protein
MRAWATKYSVAKATAMFDRAETALEKASQRLSTARARLRMAVSTVKTDPEKVEEEAAEIRDLFDPEAGDAWIFCLGHVDRQKFAVEVQRETGMEPGSVGHIHLRKIPRPWADGSVRLVPTQPGPGAFAATICEKPNSTPQKSPAVEKPYQISVDVERLDPETTNPGHKRFCRACGDRLFTSIILERETGPAFRLVLCLHCVDRLTGPYRTESQNMLAAFSNNLERTLEAQDIRDGSAQQAETMQTSWADETTLCARCGIEAGQLAGLWTRDGKGGAICTFCQSALAALKATAAHRPAKEETKDKCES